MGTTSSTIEPRRILLVTNLFPPQELGGYGRQLWEFGRALLSRGHELAVLTVDVPEMEREREPGLGWYEERVDRSLQAYLEWSQQPLERIASRPEINRICALNVAAVEAKVADWKPDFCLLGNLDGLGSGVMDVLVGAKVPTLHILGNMHSGYPSTLAPESSYYRLAPCSHFLGKKLLSSGFAKEYHCLYPGSLLERYAGQPRKREQKAPLRIVYASLLMPSKGPYLLVEALKLLKERGLAFEATLAGMEAHDTTQESLEALIRQLGLNSQVQVPGHLGVDALADLYRASDVLVFPTFSDEPFGRSSIEAMAAGLPVVTSATGGQREIVRDRVDGLHFARGNAEELADKLTELAEDTELYAQLSASACERAKAFTTDRSIDALEQILLQMLEQAGQGPEGGRRQAVAARAREVLKMLEEGRLREALPKLEALQDIGKGIPEVYLVIGAFLLTQREFEQAEDALRYCLEADPRCRRAHELLVLLFEQAGRPADAKPHTEALSGLTPTVSA